MINEVATVQWPDPQDLYDEIKTILEETPDVMDRLAGSWDTLNLYITDETIAQESDEEEPEFPTLSTEQYRFLLGIWLALDNLQMS